MSSFVSAWQGFGYEDYCASERIVIELEGDAHDPEMRRDYDRARARFLEAAGSRIIRIRNRDVNREHLETALRRALETNRSSPLSRRERGSGGEDKQADEVAGVRTNGERWVRD